MKYWVYLRRLLTVLLAVATAILAGVLYISRHQVHERIAELSGAHTGFVGDSIIAGGRAWDWTMGSPTFDTRNFGQGGAPIEIISWITKNWVIPVMKPKKSVIMAGTNNAVKGEDAEYFQSVFEEYLNLLNSIESSGAAIVVCSTPPRADPAFTPFYRFLNTNLANYCQSNRIQYLDLWPALTDGEILRPEMTSDGIHLTSKAYRIWGEELSKILKSKQGGFVRNMLLCIKTTFDQPHTTLL